MFIPCAYAGGTTDTMSYIVLVVMFVVDCFSGLRCGKFRWVFEKWTSTSLFYGSLCSSEVCTAKGLLKLHGQIPNINHNILTDINCNMQQHPNTPIQIICSACALHKRRIDLNSSKTDHQIIQNDLLILDRWMSFDLWTDDLTIPRWETFPIFQPHRWITVMARGPRRCREAYPMIFEVVGGTGGIGDGTCSAPSIPLRYIDIHRPHTCVQEDIV